MLYLKRRGVKIYKVYLLIYRDTNCLVPGSIVYMLLSQAEDFRNKLHDSDEIEIIEKELD